LVSTKIMEKMNSKSIPNHNLYRVSWLKKGQEVIVIEKCLLSFHIGSFNKQFLCDVIEMDACHVLLERPWMFDIKVFNDGRENSYEFVKDRKRYKFVPMLENNMDNSNNKVMNINNNEVMNKNNNNNMHGSNS
jgi:hypothetical protein